MFKQKKLSGGARFGLWAASSLLGLLLFVAALTTALIANVRIVTSQDGISGIIRTVMASPAQAGSEATSPEEAPEDVASGLTDQLIGMFYEETNNQLEEGFQHLGGGGGAHVPLSLEKAPEG